MAAEEVEGEGSVEDPGKTRGAGAREPKEEEVWAGSPEEGSVLRQAGPWLPSSSLLLSLGFFLLLIIPRTLMHRLLADGAGLPGLSEPGSTAAVISCQEEQR